MSTLSLQTPRAFLPLLQPVRYKGAHGGRGSGKSHFFAERLIEECIADPTTRAVCVREIQKSLDQSVKQLLEDKIASLGVQDYFEALDTEIHVLDDDGQRTGLIIFQGCRTTRPESIKSLEGYRIAWVEEAQSLSQRSLDLLTPTIRLPGSEIWFSWNPRKPTDPVDAFMRSEDAANDNDIACIQVNYRDNPWFWDSPLARDMERDKRRDKDKYAHVWLGAYLKRSAASVFKNWREADFEVPPGLRPYFGADWGFSVDPSVLVKCYVDEPNRRILVDAEAYEVGCEIDDTAALFAGTDEQKPERWANRNPKRWAGVPGAVKWPIRADSARPEIISHLNKRGFKITPARKGPGSVEEGVTFLQNYDIIVRPTCIHTIDELSLYSYKVDKLTDEVLPELEDKKNHVIDSLRYAVEDLAESAVATRFRHLRQRERLSMADDLTPETESSDYGAMKPYWDMVSTILDGADAMREAAETYLPRFPNEQEADYEYRAANAKFTNIYADIVSNLSAKPFAEPVTLVDGAASEFDALAEDIDGRGNNLHVFAAETFFSGINNAIDWILVDYTKAQARQDGQPLSLTEEKAQGLRPYWVHVPATRMLAVYSDTIRGQELFVHARIRENLTRREGFGEVCIERVRVLNREPIFLVVEGVETDRIVDYAPATFEVWEKTADDKGKEAWEIVDQGLITIGVIQLVPFITGRRIDGSWRFVPPLKDAAFLQVEHYQQETALKSIKELTAFPMLAGNGVQPAVENGKPAVVPVGPRTVLYAPPTGETGQHGEWTFIEPSAESLKFLADDVANTEKQLRELGRQPLTATAGITVVTAALASQKASSTVQAWAWGLKDALEQAFKLTAMWLGQADGPEVKVFTDFAMEAGDEQGPANLVLLRKSGPNSEPDISRETLWEELQRRSFLSGDFDADLERQRLEDELPDPAAEAEIMAAALPPANDPNASPADPAAAA